LGIVHDRLVLLVDLVAAVSRLVERRAPAACGSTVSMLLSIVGAVCSAVFPRSAAEYALVVSEALRLWDTPGMCGIVVVCKEKGIREAERRKRKAGGGKITGDK
jgi:hypothetical protein